MKREEEVIEITSYKSDQAPYYAFILSIVWNFLFLFLLLFFAHQRKNLTFTVPCEPMVIFQNPLISAQNKQQPIQLQAPSVAQPEPQTLQQIALQQPQNLASPEDEAFNYLVNQLISYGNSSNGAVVSAVDDVPDHLASDINASEPATIEQQAPTFDAQEQAQETPESNAPQDQETNELHESGQSDQNSRSENQPLSNQDIELLQETAQSIATTFPNESSRTLQNNPSTTPGGNSHYVGDGHQPRYRSPYPSSCSPKKSVTLADLAHSYMNHVRDDRHIKYNYDPQQHRGGMGMPGVYSPAKTSCTGKELALEMYATKVFMMMQQSAHALSSLIYAQTDFTEQSFLEITINHTGKLERVTLNPPIHEKDVELAVQKIVERVGLFPPIPKHFNQDSITLTFPLNIQGSKGFGRYSLSYSAGGRP